MGEILFEAYQLVGAAIFLPFIFFIVVYFYKLDKKSMEFKIIGLGFVNLVIVAECAVVATIVFVGDLVMIGQIVVYPVGFSVILIITHYMIKYIRVQNKVIKEQSANLVKILQASTETSLNVSNNATELAASASEVNSSAEEIAATTMEVTIKAKDQAQSLSEINSMAQDIGRITKIITNISEQTNLLALNASIEAGRAGESGLGFAVVADKVQKLAEESKNSVEKTVDIVALILQKIQNAAQNSEEISRAMEEISTAAEEQTASMEEISATAGVVGHETESLKAQLQQQGIGQLPISKSKTYK